MAKHKVSTPEKDGKMDAPTGAGRWDLGGVADVIEATGLSTTGFKEVVSAKSPQDALVQTITHPVVLAVVVGALLLTFGGMRR
jgi:hypothetical protein